MEEEILELKEEISVLNERISELEKSNNRRKAYGYAKAFVKISLVLLTIFGIWQGYEYVVNELPKLVEEKVQEIKNINPLKSSN